MKKRVVFNSSSIFCDNIKFDETPENEFWDYKAIIDTKKEGIDIDIAKDICAFANTFGGTLLIGVSEKKGIASGFSNGNDFNRIKQFINDNVLKKIQPKINVDTILLDIKENQVIAVNIKPLIYALACVTITNNSFSYLERSEYGNEYLTPLEIEKRLTSMSYRQHEIFLREKVPENGNNDIIFISKIYRESYHSYTKKCYICEFKQHNFHISKYNEWDFEVSLNGYTLNIPYNAIKKVWIDVFKKVNFELDLMIVLDDDKLKLCPIDYKRLNSGMIYEHI